MCDAWTGTKRYSGRSVRLHLSGLLKCPRTKRGQHGLGLPYQVDPRIHWPSASDGSAVDVSA